MFRFDPVLGQWDRGVEIGMPICEGYNEPLPFFGDALIYPTCAEMPGELLHVDTATSEVTVLETTMSRVWTSTALVRGDLLFDPAGLGGDDSPFNPRAIELDIDMDLLASG